MREVKLGALASSLRRADCRALARQSARDRTTDGLRVWGAIIFCKKSYSQSYDSWTSSKIVARSSSIGSVKTENDCIMIRKHMIFFNSGTSTNDLLSSPSFELMGFHQVLHVRHSVKSTQWTESVTVSHRHKHFLSFGSFSKLKKFRNVNAFLKMLFRSLNSQHL